MKKIKKSTIKQWLIKLLVLFIVVAMILTGFVVMFSQ